MSKIFVTGDFHGDPKQVSSKNWPEGKKLTKDDVLVQLGDFGIIWKNWNNQLAEIHKQPAPSEEMYWMEWLADKPWTTAVVLGNHENYDRLDLLPWIEKWGGRVQVYHTPKGDIFFLERGGIYEINGKKILAISGALSVDKHMRTTGISHWEQELHTHDETEFILNNIDKNNRKFDFVFTHTCPDHIVQEFLDGVWGYAKITDSVAQMLGNIENIIEYKHWYFGHFHTNRDFEDFTCLYSKVEEVV